MTAAEALTVLFDAGVKLYLGSSGGLRYSGPTKAYTAELRALVDEHRTELVELLSHRVVSWAQVSAVPWDGTCNDCGGRGSVVFLEMADHAMVCHRCWSVREQERAARAAKQPHAAERKPTDAEADEHILTRWGGGAPASRGR